MPPLSVASASTCSIVLGSGYDGSAGSGHSHSRRAGALSDLRVQALLKAAAPDADRLTSDLEIERI
jgi:hypothetical protein